MAQNLKATIRDNVRRLLNLAPGDSGVTQVMALGFANGTAQRILDDKTMIRVNQIEALAARLRVQPWQLCVPGLDPDRLPDIEPRSFRWPFRTIAPEVITGLVGTAAAQVENGLLAVLATAGISPRGGGAALMTLEEANAIASRSPGLPPAPAPALPSTRTPQHPSEHSELAPTEAGKNGRG